MLSKLIQQKVFIGDEVKFILKTGRDILGELVEIGLNHITVENNDGPATILTDMIGGWEVINKDKESLDKKQNYNNTFIQDEKISSDNKSLKRDKIFIKRTDSKDKAQPLESSSLILRENQSGKGENNGELQKRIHIEAIKKLTEINAKYNIHFEVAELNIKIPAFSIPDNELKKFKNNVLVSWNRVKNKYEYAQKVNELSSEYGRIQDIVIELKGLIKICPESACFKQHLAYLLSISGYNNDALECSKASAINSSQPQNWFNLAAIAMKCNKEELACYSLEQFFSEIPAYNELTAWYVYLSLVIKFQNYQGLNRILDKINTDSSEKNLNILLETGIYLLNITKGEEQAIEAIQKWVTIGDSKSILLELFKLFDNKPAESYKQFTIDFLFDERDRKKKEKVQEVQNPKGYIFTYKNERNYGFLRDLNGKQYFFHRSAIIDETIYDKLSNLSLGQEIPVVFETAESPKGSLAIKISQFHTIAELFDLANNYASNGEYSTAIAHIKRVLAINSAYSNSQELFEKWREYARATGIPKGSTPFARAKRVQIVEKDLERAIQLFNEAIKKNDNAESAVKDLAMLLVQLDRAEEAIKILKINHNKISDKQSLDNLFIQIYQKANKHDEVINLLQNNLKRTSNQEKKAQILYQIAGSNLRLENYERAEEIFKKVLKLRPNTVSIQRNIALCLSKQKKYDEAGKILNRILTTSSDAKSLELLDAINQDKSSGISSEIDQIIIETTLSDFSAEVSSFSKFFLNQCDFQGVPPDRVQTRDFRSSDLKRLEDLATQLGTKNPRDRSNYYLSATKIISVIEENNPNQFYRYLCRCFASYGDASLSENKHIDSARELYCEALIVYDGVRSQRKDEQDAVNALVRFLFSTLGQAQIPTSHKIPSIDETIETVISRHPDQNKVFDAIAYLITHSRYAANRIINRLYNKTTLQALSLKYFKYKEIQILNPPKSLDDFVRYWNELRRKNFDKFRIISNQIQYLNNFKLTTAWIENSIEQLKSVIDLMFFDLDRQRIQSLQSILENALDLCKQNSFEEQERLCILIDSRCQDTRKEIAENATRLSIESIYPVVQVMQQKVKDHLADLYETSKPQTSLRLAVESYPNNKEIEIQIVVTNKMGCSPAESIELVILEQDERLFTINQPNIKLAGSLRGDDQRILKIPLTLKETALQSQTFSLSLYVQYRTRLEEVENTPVSSFSIRLYSEEDFDEINNPYADYAEGGIVGDPDMFYGREELIKNISMSIKESRLQSKCIIVFGQKRAGKSSILYHLKNFLLEKKDIIVLDIGNIGSLLDVSSRINLLYQILWNIVSKFKDAVEDRVDEGYSQINLSFPSFKEFTGHPSPLLFFKELFDQYKRITLKQPDWENIRIVVLIDEFSYIYSFIVSGHLPEMFMKNWKALLQENYFNAVLAGQDVMPKFKQHFPNEFGTTQDERVSYLKYEDAVRLIDEPIRIGGKAGETRYREKAIDRIVELTAGSPFYIQIICNRLVEYMNRKHARLVTEADVDQVKKDLIRGVNALSLDKFDNLINSGDTSGDAISDEDAIKVLKTIATNSLTGPCNQNCISCETSLPIDKILNDLVNREVIERERERYYKIRVGLFKEWLVTNL